MRRVQRVSPLHVPLINPDHASAASAQMVQHRLGDFEAHAEALQPRRKRPAQVVPPPAGNTGCGVERRLRFRPAAKGRSAHAREDECQLRPLVRALDIPGPVGREGVQKLACWLAQRYEMRNAVLGSRGWYRPGRQVFRKLGPRHPCHFLAPLARQHQIDGRWP